MKRKIRYLVSSLINFVIVMGSFLVVAWLRPATVNYVLPHYWKPVLLYSLIWIVVSALGGKYSSRYRSSFRKVFSTLFFSDFFVLAIISIIMVVFTKIGLSRIIIFGTTVLAFLIELILYGIHWRITKKKIATIAVQKVSKKNIIQDVTLPDEIDTDTDEGLNQLRQQKKPKITYNLIQLIILDLILFIAAFLFVTWLKDATRRVVIPTYWQPMVICSVIWLFISFFSEKYFLKQRKKISTMFSVILMTNLIIISFIAILVLAVKAFHYSRLVVFGTMVVTTVLEMFLAWVYFFTSEFQKTNPEYAKSSLVTDSDALEEDAETLLQDEHRTAWKPMRYDPKFASSEKLEDSILMRLMNKYLKDDEQLFEFINDSVALENVHKDNSQVLNTTTLYNIEIEDDDSLEFFLNLHRVNDMRRLNKYFIKVNSKLKEGAIFIGVGMTLKERRRKIRERFPRMIAMPILALDFILNRVFPKLTFFKGIYFACTKGSNRPLSKCEILGRLNYCGFEIIDEREIDNLLYFVVKKVSKPSRDTNPSYGPLFRMKRRGKHGKFIYVYKFRTMHPYSEYLQHYMVERYGYGDKGKIDDDFRVTEWGRIIRKLWLDELPQLLNWFKGDLALVGVRPLSERFLKEYPEELREERFKYKPGCIPPYVALRMQRVEDYLISEKIYLQDKRKHPFFTDIKYFFWAVYNILTNRIRSE